MKKEERDEYAQTYGLFKFKRPLPEEVESAMGLVGESNLFKKMICGDYERFYDEIRIPEEGDWLMTHKEYGQTYDQYINKDIIPVDNNHKVIYIVPLSFNSNDFIDQKFYECVISLCEAFFSGMKVSLLEVSNTFNNIDTKKVNDKIKINADQLLERLSEEIPMDAFFLFGLLDTDLYTEYTLPNGNVVTSPTYGTKNLKERISIFSFVRFDPLFFKKEQNLSKEKRIKVYFILLKRVCSAITRELCYMFGMKNCVYFSCCMNGTNRTEFDNKQIELCPVCLRKLITNINAMGKDLKSYRFKNPMVVFERFVKLRNVLRDNFFGLYENEVNWFNARIDYLKTVI